MGCILLSFTWWWLRNGNNANNFNYINSNGNYNNNNNANNSNNIALGSFLLDKVNPQSGKKSERRKEGEYNPPIMGK